jgi:hypothetical protein
LLNVDRQTDVVTPTGTLLQRLGGRGNESCSVSPLIYPLPGGRWSLRPRPRPPGGQKLHIITPASIVTSIFPRTPAVFMVHRRDSQLLHDSSTSPLVIHLLLQYRVPRNSPHLSALQSTYVFLHYRVLIEYPPLSGAQVVLVLS